MSDVFYNNKDIKLLCDPWMDHDVHQYTTEEIVLMAKAVPISWLEEKAEHYQRAYEAEVEQNGYDASRYYLDMYNAIYTLIDEWETENG